MRRLALAFVLLFSLASLSAGTLNVGLVQSGAGDETFATTVVTTLFDLLPANSRLERINFSRFEEERVRSEERALHTALANETTPSASRSTTYTPYYSSSPVYRIVNISASEDFATGRNASMLSYWRQREALDLIIAFIFGQEEGLGTLDVYIYIEGAVAEVYSTLYPNGGLWEREGEVLSRLVSFFSSSVAVLDLSAFPFSRVYDAASGQEVARTLSWALVDRSLTGITIRTNGYEELSVPLELADVAGPYEVTGELEEVQVGQVTIQAHPYGASARLFGLDVALPLETGFHSGAVLLTIGMEGFRDENLQLRPGEGFVSVRLRPTWMGEDGRLAEAKDGLYRSLRNSLLSFGLYVIMSSIANIYPEAESWSSVASGFAMGLSVVNALDFIHDCFAYYNSARQVYR